MNSFAVKWAGRTRTENRYRVVESAQSYQQRIYAAMPQGTGENLLCLDGASDLRAGEFVKATKTGRAVRTK